MKIKFDDKYNFIEVKKTDSGIEIILSSKNFKSPRTAIVNSVVLNEEQFKKLISDIDLK